jgi:hypothetical protein
MPACPPHLLRLNAALAQLVKLGIAEKITGQPRDRVYAYQAHLRILGEGTEPV